MSYNTEMQENNAELEEILAEVNALPEAGATGDYIPVPATAEVGQTIRVSAVDENGKPTAWEAVDMASGGGSADEYVLVLSKVFEADALNTDEWGGESHLFGYRHFWTTDVDGNDLDIDGIYVRIHVPAQTGDGIVSSGELICGVGKGKPKGWLSWRGSYQKQPYIGFPSFVSTGGKEVWCTFDIDLRLQTYKAQRVEGQTYIGNYRDTSVCAAPAFADAVARNNWDTLSGVQIDLVTGSLPTGTNILIYARKRNAEKVAELPKWSVVT